MKDRKEGTNQKECMIPSSSFGLNAERRRAWGEKKKVREEKR